MWMSSSMLLAWYLIFFHFHVSSHNLTLVWPICLLILLWLTACVQWHPMSLIRYCPLPPRKILTFSKCRPCQTHFRWPWWVAIVCFQMFWDIVMSEEWPRCEEPCINSLEESALDQGVQGCMYELDSIFDACDLVYTLHGLAAHAIDGIVLCSRWYMMMLYTLNYIFM